jgi:hypothetical protein
MGDDDLVENVVVGRMMLKTTKKKDFLEEMMRHTEAEFLLMATKRLNNLETLKKARKERLNEEAKGYAKRWSLLFFVLDMLILKAKYG